MCLLSCHALCRQLSIQSTENFLIVLEDDIFWLLMNEIWLGSSKIFHAGPHFLSMFSFYFSFKIFNYSSHWVRKVYLQLLRSFECVSLAIRAEIISHFLLDQQFCARFQNPWMLLVGLIFSL